jgi:hypothetical protein
MWIKREKFVKKRKLVADGWGNWLRFTHEKHTTPA